MSGYVYADNSGDEEIQCGSWFRHTQYDGNGPQANAVGDPLTSNGPSERIGRGEYYYAYSDSMTNYPVPGGDIADDKEYYFNAHIHLETGEDDRHVDSSPFIITFTSADNPD